MATIEPLHFYGAIDLPISIEKAWDLLSNIEYLGRMIGLPQTFYGQSIIEEEGTFRWAETKANRLVHLKWKEYPFEWIKPEQYSVKRIYDIGPVSDALCTMKLKVRDEGCRVQVTVEVTPRNMLGGMAIRSDIEGAIQGTMDYCLNASNLMLKSPNEVYYLGKPSALEPLPKESALQKMRKNGVDTNSNLVKLLLDHLEKGTDEQVTGMQPFVLADQWRVDRKENLFTFLQAARAELLEMEWGMICPNCRIPKATYNTLVDVRSEFHCGFCDTSFPTDLDHNVELRFNVASAIRPVERNIFCIGAPFNSPHIVLQQNLALGETREVVCHLKPEMSDLRLRVQHYNQSLDLAMKEEASPDPTFVYDGTSWKGFVFNGTDWIGDKAELKSGQSIVTLYNSSNKPATIVLERTSWHDQAVTAARVINLAEFRAWFRKEMVAPGRGIAVKKVRFMMVELKGALQLFKTMSDAQALDRIRYYLDYLKEKVRINHGTVIRISGNTLLASFSDSTYALSCAMEMQAWLKQFHQIHQFESLITLRIGLHVGSALAMNTNGTMDYFGRNLNITSHLQHLGGAGEVMCSAEFLSESSIEEVLVNYAYIQQYAKKELKGVDGPFRLCRIQVGKYLKPMIPKPVEKKEIAASTKKR